MKIWLERFPVCFVLSNRSGIGGREQKRLVIVILATRKVFNNIYTIDISSMNLLCMVTVMKFKQYSDKQYSNKQHSNKQYIEMRVGHNMHFSRSVEKDL